MSTIQSAARMVSSSCSTTISVLPKIAQPLERADQALVVALMQADARLVQDVQHACQTRADLRRQTNALRLTTRERGRRPTQRQIVEPDVDQKAQAGDATPSGICRAIAKFCGR